MHQESARKAAHSSMVALFKTSVKPATKVPNVTVVEAKATEPFGKNTFRNNLLANQSSGLALELIDAKLPEPYYGHVFLSDCPSNPCLSDQSSPNANLHGRSYQLTGCKSRFRGGIKAHMLNVVLPELPSGCQNSFREAVAKGKFRSMPNSFLPPSKQKVPGLLFLGDALNMRHPLTGGGMTVAMTYY